MGPTDQPLPRRHPSENPPRLVVAIDGPAGAGKSTVARTLAERLGYSLLDTGAIYRALALLALRGGISWDDGPQVAALAHGLDIRFQLEGAANRVFVKGADVTLQIRTPEISDAASRVSALPEVRLALLDLQRRLGAGGGVVVEGRDVTTVVFPDAEAKFFLTATADERARRRTAELRAAGRPADHETVLRDIEARDLRDSTRAVAPLKKAEGALEVDSSALDIEQVVESMLAVIRSKMPPGGDAPHAAPPGSNV